MYRVLKSVQKIALSVLKDCVTRGRFCTIYQKPFYCNTVYSKHWITAKGYDIPNNLHMM